MLHRVVLIAVLVLSLSAPLAAVPTPALAQDGCGSAFWLNTSGGGPANSAHAWMNYGLTDACTGAPFSLAGFAGKTVYVETMATWCSTCHSQLTHLQDAAAQLTDEQRQNIVMVALSTETDLTSQTLAEYAAFNGFPFVFAVMPAEMLQAMAGSLGQDVAVPPAAPKLLISADGTPGALYTGVQDAAGLLELFATAGI